jgi:hypothetical protein
MTTIEDARQRQREGWHYLRGVPLQGRIPSTVACERTTSGQRSRSLIVNALQVGESPGRTV